MRNSSLFSIWIVFSRLARGPPWYANTYVNRKGFECFVKMRISHLFVKFHCWLAQQHRPAQHKKKSVRTAVGGPNMQWSFIKIVSVCHSVILCVVATMQRRILHFPNSLNVWNSVASCFHRCFFPSAWFSSDECDGTRRISNQSEE